MRGKAELPDIFQLMKRGVVLFDGAMGTMLQRFLARGEAPDFLNVKNPDAVVGVHKAYVEAGSLVIETNSFGSNPYRVEAYGGRYDAFDLSKRAASLARLASDGQALVAGSVGPLGAMLEPLGDVKKKDAIDAFKRQVSGLCEGGVDMLIVETMADVNEVEAAVIAIKDVCDLPVIATMTFDETGRTMMGFRADEAPRVLRDIGADVAGANCGVGSRDALHVMSMMVKNRNGVPLIVQPNAGVPQLIEGIAVYPETPEEMAERSEKFVEMGIEIVGACCGSTPEHIRAISNRIGPKLAKLII